MKDYYRNPRLVGKPPPICSAKYSTIHQRPCSEYDLTILFLHSNGKKGGVQIQKQDIKSTYYRQQLHMYLGTVQYRIYDNSVNLKQTLVNGTIKILQLSGVKNYSLLLPANHMVHNDLYISYNTNAKYTNLIKLTVYI